MQQFLFCLKLSVIPSVYKFGPSSNPISPDLWGFVLFLELENTAIKEIEYLGEKIKFQANIIRLN